MKVVVVGSKKEEVVEGKREGGLLCVATEARPLQVRVLAATTIRAASELE